MEPFQGLKSPRGPPCGGVCVWGGGGWGGSPHISEGQPLYRLRDSGVDSLSPWLPTQPLPSHLREAEASLELRVSSQRRGGGAPLNTQNSVELTCSGPAPLDQNIYLREGSGSTVNDGSGSLNTGGGGFFSAAGPERSRKFKDMVLTQQGECPEVLGQRSGL